MEDSWGRKESIRSSVQSFLAEARRFICTEAKYGRIERVMSNRPYPIQINGEWRKDVVITGNKVNKSQTP